MGGPWRRSLKAPSWASRHTQRAHPFSESRHQIPLAPPTLPASRHTQRAHTFSESRNLRDEEAFRIFIYPGAETKTGGTTTCQMGLGDGTVLADGPILVYDTV